MYYSYAEIKYVATSFSPTRMDLALKLLNSRQFLREYDHPLSPSATATVVLVNHPGVHRFLPPPCNPAFLLLLLLQLLCPPQSFQLDSCQQRLQTTEPDTGGVDDGRLRATLECSGGKHAASWGEKGCGMCVEYYHEKC
jgi:hypothetical protein